MASLATRQKIIFGVMGIAVLYGAVDFLMPKKKDIGIDVKQKTEELNTFVTTLSAGISKDTAISLGPLIFARAEKEWAKDPFLDEKSLKEWIKAKEPIKKGLLKEGMIARRSNSVTPVILRWTENGWPSSMGLNMGKAMPWISKGSC